MEKKLNFMERNNRKEYRPPQVEIVEVMIEKGFDPLDSGGGGEIGPPPP